MNYITQPVKNEIMEALETSETPSDNKSFDQFVPQVISPLRPGVYALGR
nr:hypothetical protein [uncultured Desulfobacter sp.]